MAKEDIRKLCQKVREEGKQAVDFLDKFRAVGVLLSLYKENRGPYTHEAIAYAVYLILQQNEDVAHFVDRRKGMGPF